MFLSRSMVLDRGEGFDRAASDTGLHLDLRTDGQLWAVDGPREAQVKVNRCFPWSEPGRLISLRDNDGEEFALVGDPSDLDPSSRQVLEAALAEAGFLLEVEAVLEVEDEVEIRSWRVRTRQGERAFQTRLDDWPRSAPGGGLIIRDVAGDLYLVAEADRMDYKSRQLLWAFLD